MNKIVLLIMMLLFTIKSSKSQGKCDTVVAPEKCMQQELERKTDTLIAVIHEVQELANRKESLQKELRLLNQQIREREIIKQINKHHNRGM